MVLAQDLLLLIMSLQNVGRQAANCTEQLRCGLGLCRSCVVLRDRRCVRIFVVVMTCGT